MPNYWVSRRVNDKPRIPWRWTKFRNEEKHWHVIFPAQLAMLFPNLRNPTSIQRSDQIQFQGWPRHQLLHGWNGEALFSVGAFSAQWNPRPLFQAIDRGNLTKVSQPQCFLVHIDKNGPDLWPLKVGFMFLIYLLNCGLLVYHPI